MRRNVPAGQMSADGREHIVQARLRPWGSHVRTTAVERGHEAGQAALEIESGGQKLGEPVAKAWHLGEIVLQVGMREIEVDAVEEGRELGRKIGAYQARVVAFELCFHAGAGLRIIDARHDHAIDLAAAQAREEIAGLSDAVETDRDSLKKCHGKPLLTPSESRRW